MGARSHFSPLTSPDGSKVLLGKRKVHRDLAHASLIATYDLPRMHSQVHPQPDWWFVGGRIFPGETPAQSCCRLLRRELGLEIAPSRLQPVCCQSFA